MLDSLDIPETRLLFKRMYNTVSLMSKPSSDIVRSLKDSNNTFIKSCLETFKVDNQYNIFDLKFPYINNQSNSESRYELLIWINLIYHILGIRPENCLNLEAIDSVLKESPKESKYGFLKPGYTVLDVGCYRGIFSAYALHKKCKVVYSIDANKDNLDFTKKVLELNGFSQDNVFLQLFSDRVLPTLFYTTETLDESSTDITSIPSKIDVIRSEMLVSSTLDSFVTEKSIPVDYISIDTNNTEYLVLLGSLESIRKYSPTIVTKCINKEHLKLQKDIILSADKNYKFYLAKKVLYSYI